MSLENEVDAPEFNLMKTNRVLPDSVEGKEGGE